MRESESLAKPMPFLGWVARISQPSAQRIPAATSHYSAQSADLIDLSFACFSLSFPAGVFFLFLRRNQKEKENGDNIKHRISHIVLIRHPELDWLLFPKFLISWKMSGFPQHLSNYWIQNRIMLIAFINLRVSIQALEILNKSKINFHFVQVIF